jgi:pSer/pThr/pTyr-binding forkhead associated (FHA) protein
MKPSPPPTGRKIVLELVNEMEHGLYPLLYRVLPPSVYHVYLHPDDYREIEGITPLLLDDARKALSARVDELNNQSKWTKLISGKRPRIEHPPGGWEIGLHSEANGEVNPGELGIVSKLALPATAQYEGGSPTTRIVKTVITGSIRKSTATEEAAPPASPVAATQAADGKQGFARVAYVDDQGPHVFVMRKDLISIGRGGSAHWVDIQLVTNPRVSREHCRIRRDAQGRFFVQDVSTWGTSINGERVPPYVQEANGQLQETGQERELPREARIQLADAVVLDFQAYQGQG